MPTPPVVPPWLDNPGVAECYQSSILHPDSWALAVGNVAANRDAAKICRTCELRKDCLTYGVASQSSGVWGGVLLRDGQPSTRQPRRTAPQAERASA